MRMHHRFKASLAMLSLSAGLLEKCQYGGSAAIAMELLLSAPRARRRCFLLQFHPHLLSVGAIYICKS